MLPQFLTVVKLKRFIGLLIIACFYFAPVKAQYFDLNNNRKRVYLHFKLVRNMVVIQLNINNKGPYNFILDTGVGLMIITDPKLVDSLAIPNRRTLKLYGLGEGDDFEAYATSALKIDIPGLTSYDVAAAILKKDHFQLSNYAGMPVHGLLGYEFFNNLAVKIDFADSTLTICRPRDVKMLKKGSKIPITIEDRKPYLIANIKYDNGTEKKNKLIIDLGAGHPVSLENMISNHGLPTKFITANLGVGFNGPIHGFISRVARIDIGNYKVKNVIASFPEEDSVRTRLQSVQRDGNLGFGLLKKFTVIFDYRDSLLYLKPGPKINDPFEHDMSGLEYYGDGENFQHVIISRVEPGSAADEVGLEKYDEIVAINFKPVATMSLEEIDSMFKSADDRSLLLDIFHDKKYDRVILTLKRRI